MSRPLITLAVVNTFTTAMFTYFYNHYVQTRRSQEHVNSLLLRITELEQRVESLQSTIEELEEALNKKNNRIIESNLALSSKLDDFINYSYDVYDE